MAKSKQAAPSITAGVDRSWSEVVGDLEKLASDLGKLSSESVGAGQELLIQEIARLRSTSEDILGRAKSQGERMGTSVADYIRENPIGSTIGAFAAGTLLALMLNKR